MREREREREREKEREREIIEKNSGEERGFFCRQVLVSYFSVVERIRSRERERVREKERKREREKERKRKREKEKSGGPEERDAAPGDILPCDSTLMNV